MREPHVSRSQVDRRGFLKTAGALAAVAATGACDPTPDGDAADAAARTDAATRRRDVALDRATLLAVGDVVLPGELGATGRARAVDAFVAWIAGYDPVAERMHGYGYADIRYLPPDPAPGWRAQLDGLDLLARRSRGARFAALEAAERRALVEAAIADVAGPRLPAPLTAGHVALALLAHWAASPAARDLAHGARIAPATCRPLADVTRRPLPLAPDSARPA